MIEPWVESILAFGVAIKDVVTASNVDWDLRSVEIVDFLLISLNQGSVTRNHAEEQNGKSLLCHLVK